MVLRSCPSVTVRPVLCGQLGKELGPGNHRFPLQEPAPAPHGGFRATEQASAGEMGSAHPKILLQLRLLLGLHDHLHHSCLPPAFPGAASHSLIKSDFWGLHAAVGPHSDPAWGYLPLTGPAVVLWRRRLFIWISFMDSYFEILFLVQALLTVLSQVLRFVETEWYLPC